MRTRTASIRTASATLTLLAGFAGLAGIASPGYAVVAEAGPSVSSIVQQVGNPDSADARPAVGVLHPAVTGITTGPLIDATPQYKHA